MEPEAVKAWLATKAKAESVASFFTGIFYALGGLLGTLIVAGGVAWGGLYVLGKVAAAMGESGGWAAAIQLSWTNVGWLALVLILWMFIGGTRVQPDDPTAMARAFMDFFYAGPRFVVEGLGGVRRAVRLRNIDDAVHTTAMLVLLDRPQRVPLTELADTIEGFDIETTVENLKMIDGVVLLTSEPPGLSLTTDLREELTGKPAGTHQERARIGGQRVVFQCQECGSKLRIRLFLVGLTHRCPVCQTRYRSFMDSRGQVILDREIEAEAEPVPAYLQKESYEILGLAAGTSTLEIKRAYRRLMKQNHPDLVPEADPVKRQQAEEKTKSINQAYEALLTHRRVTGME